MSRAEPTCYRTIFPCASSGLQNGAFRYIVLRVMLLTYIRAMIRSSNCGGLSRMSLRLTATSGLLYTNLGGWVKTEMKFCWLDIIEQNIVMAVNVLKFLKLVAQQRRHRQTAHTQIRLPLKKQANQGLHVQCITFVTCSLDNQHFIWEQNGKSIQNFRTFNAKRLRV